eukprot:scaffold42353_cov168-Amphora_coffeaeformis.AAC.2
MRELLAAVARNGKIKKLRLFMRALPVTQTLTLCLSSLRDSLQFLELQAFSLTLPQQELPTEEEIRNDAETIAEAVKSLRELKELHLMYGFVEDFWLPFLTALGTDAPFSKLGVFSLSEIEIEDDDREPLARAIDLAITKMPALYSFSLCPDFFHPNHNFRDIFFRSLESHPGICDLDLLVSNLCVPHIIRMIMHNTRIKSLSLSLDGMHWCNVCSILKAFSRETHHTLESLTLRDMPLRDNAEEKQNQLGPILSNIKGIQTLRFQYYRTQANALDRPAIALPPAFLDGFGRNTSLTHVSIDWCHKWTDDDRVIDFYAVRNDFIAKLRATKGGVIDTFPYIFDAFGGPADLKYPIDAFEHLHVEHDRSRHYPESALTLVFEYLRARIAWAN